MHRGGRDGPPPRRGYQGPRHYRGNNQGVDSVGDAVEDSEDFAAFVEDGFRNNVVHSRQSEAC